MIFLLASKVFFLALRSDLSLDLSDVFFGALFLGVTPSPRLLFCPRGTNGSSTSVLGENKNGARAHFYLCLRSSQKGR